MLSHVNHDVVVGWWHNGCNASKATKRLRFFRRLQTNAQNARMDCSHNEPHLCAGGARRSMETARAEKRISEARGERTEAAMTISTTT
jgi:hypothetical protein